jgi:peptidoglycan hydrolase CwlO-like protein
MKTIKIIMIALIVAPVIGFAQQTQTPAEEAKKQTEWMQKNLDLTEDQLEEVKALNTEYADKRTEIMNSQDEKQDKLNDLMAERDQYTREIREILDDQQFVKFQEAEKTWFENTKKRIGDSRE